MGPRTVAKKDSVSKLLDEMKKYTTDPKKYVAETNRVMEQLRRERLDATQRALQADYEKKIYDKLSPKERVKLLDTRHRGAAFG